MRRLIFLIAFAIAVALPAQALAQTTGSMPAGAAGANQYVAVIPTANGGAVVPSEGGEVVPTAGEELPFTGEDVLLVVLVALIMTGAGFALYRQVRTR
jgi:hypothetical protein